MNRPHDNNDGRPRWLCICCAQAAAARDLAAAYGAAGIGLTEAIAVFLAQRVSFLNW